MRKVYIRTKEESVAKITDPKKIKSVFESIIKHTEDRSYIKSMDVKQRPGSIWYGKTMGGGHLINSVLPIASSFVPGSKDVTYS